MCPANSFYSQWGFSLQKRRKGWAALLGISNKCAYRFNGCLLNALPLHGREGKIDF